MFDKTKKAAGIPTIMSKDDAVKRAAEILGDYWLGHYYLPDQEDEAKLSAEMMTTLTGVSWIAERQTKNTIEGWDAGFHIVRDIR
jgi:hypothetical protein